MLKKCVVCGRLYFSDAGYSKYCTKRCANKSRAEKTREQRYAESQVIKEKAVELYYSDLSISEIEENTGRSKNFIYTAWKEAGLPKRPTNNQRTILKYRQQGLCSVEIAELTGQDPKYIRVIAKHIGYPFTEEEKRRAYELSNKYRKQTAEKEIAYINDNCPQWEWVSGYHSGDGEMLLKCRECGSIEKKSAITVRQNHDTKCSVCEKRNSELRKAEQQRQREAERERIQNEKIRKFWEQPFRQEVVSFCPVCNSAFVGYKKVCSPECGKKRANTLNYDKRVRKIRAAYKDKITLAELYRRDNGVCWICGKECDYEDYYKDENDNFIVGANYPSIDHVLPLSKGGIHSWDNVKLAHHYCNSLKSDKVVSL